MLHLVQVMILCYRRQVWWCVRGGPVPGCIPQSRVGDVPAPRGVSVATAGARTTHHTHTGT